MTFSFYFYPDQLLLSFIKDTLQFQGSDRNANLGKNAVCIFACAAAVEATANNLLIKEGSITHFDGMGLKSKIEIIARLGGRKINWGEEPWQRINRLIKVRNWLTHYKINQDKSLGLMNFEGWLQEPSVDPLTEFTKNSVKKYYSSVRKSLKILAEGLLLEKEYKFLDDEQFEAFLAG